MTAPQKPAAFLEEAAKYFEARPTNGEDRAHWANTYNAQNCRKAADEITRLRERIASDSRAISERDARIAELEEVLADMERAEAGYRITHDLRGAGDLRTGRAWGRLQARPRQRGVPAMKIEAGKRYRTRDGRVVKVLITEGPGTYSIWGHFEGAPGARRWDANGVSIDNLWDNIEAPVLTAEEVIAEAANKWRIGPHHPQESLAGAVYFALREAGLLREDQP